MTARNALIGECEKCGERVRMGETLACDCQAGIRVHPYINTAREKALGLVCVHGVGITRYCDECAALQGVMTREDQQVWAIVGGLALREGYQAADARDAHDIKENLRWGDIGSVRSMDGRRLLACAGLTTDEAVEAGLLAIYGI